MVPLSTLHGSESVGGAADLLENNEGLAAHLQRLQGHDIQDLREKGLSIYLKENDILLTNIL